MERYSIFQIIGPEMIGPSSSHTAGACRIGKAAREICGEDFYRAEFYLHGSFAATYKGHGTDRALVAGILGINPNDKRLINSFEISKERGIEFEFFKEDLGEVHPNTVKVKLFYKNKGLSEIKGSSIGGGNIEIIEINGNPISFKNQFPTIILRYEERTGVIANISKIISDRGYNIENMNTNKKGNMVTLTVEVTKEIDDELREEILNLEGFSFITYLNVID